MADNFLPVGLGVGARILERWEVTRIIGSGPISIVVAANDRDREFPDRAIKITAPGLLGESYATDQAASDRAAALTADITIAETLDHPNIARLFKWGRTAQGHLYTISELVSGMSLANLITGRAGNGLTPTETHHILYWTARAIAFAHSKGLLHRHIRPTKILLTEGGAIKVIDFGLGSVMFTSATIGDETRFPADIYGVAPEEFRRETPDWRTDVYSFGVLAFEILTGRKPFWAQTQEATAQAILEQPFPDVRKFRRGLPDHLVHLVTKAAQRNPEHRFPSMFEIVNLLESYSIPDERASCEAFCTARDAALSGEAVPEPAGGIRGMLPKTLRDQFKITPTMMVVAGVVVTGLALLVNNAMENNKKLRGIEAQGQKISEQAQERVLEFFKK